MDSSILSRIEASKKQLFSASAALKDRFVGLDDIIDNVIDNMTVWHAMPELIGRPVIINLWGMTGVGKTDLVRQLAKELGMMDKFVEVQLSNKSQTNEITIQKLLTHSSVEPDSQGILLLDEIQRYRTVMPDGSEIHDHDFQDIWMLLSDGKFAGQSQTKNQLMDMLIDDMYYKQQAEDNQAQLEVDEKEERKGKRKSKGKDSGPTLGSAKKATKRVVRKYKMGLWSARELKRTLRLAEPLDEIMQWNDAKRYEMIESTMNDQTTFEGNSYKQLLIFISGNLDEAYEMSGSTSDADIDADIFYEFSKRINFVTIKRVLRKKFKPEQIARLGNVHIIYPSLGKASYCEIIRRKVQEIADGVKGHGVDFKVGQSVLDAVYRNGVFPAQGVRPVLSSVNAMLGNAVPYFLLIAAQQNQTLVTIEHNQERQELVAQIGDKKYRKPVEGSIDKIKKEFDANQTMLYSVHEAGHAVVYAVLFKLSPLQIVTRSANDGGWIGVHKTCHSKTFIQQRICVDLAGLVAEEMIFGDGNRTAGCSHDIENATNFASLYIRDWAMNGRISLVVNKHQSNLSANFEIDKTNSEIEQILEREKKNCLAVLEQHRPFFEDVVEALVANKELSPQKFQKLARYHDVIVDIRSAKATMYSDYVDQFTLALPIVRSQDIKKSLDI